MTSPSSPPPLDYSRHYAKFHPETDAHRRGLQRLHERLLAPYLPADRAAPILDVGCGRGYAVQYLASLGYGAVAGIDTDAGQVAHAQAAGAAVTAEPDPVAFLTARPGTYGAVVLMDVLEHVPHADQPALVRAIHASLRPGGVLICTVPNASSPVFSHWLHNDYTHQWSFTAGSLQFLLEACGFTVRQCTGAEVTPRPRFLFWLPVPRTLAWWLRCLVRGRWRAKYVGEFGWDAGMKIPLAPNLLAVATRN